jgi:integration host factor subunit beta
MTKSGLIEKVSETIGELTRNQTEVIIETVFESMKEALSRGEKVEIRGFGNFRLKKRRPRKARNPKTGESVEVPCKSVIYFKVGKELREAINRH